ncbi:MAG: metallophosphoesterase [Eubacterium sp.]|nr:metallophosphoesterase [Eubacterium sp.]
MHYVIGDVHGCLSELKQLLEKIEEKDDSARYFFVGDFVDRGPEVMATLEWAMGHITRTGKYRSVLGNHEAMLIDWYPEFCRWYEKGKGVLPAPLPMFDFLERLVETEKDTPEAAKPYIEFFKSLPLKITVRVPGKGRRHVTYDIVHAFVPPKRSSAKEKTEHYLWDRERALEGNTDNRHVIIHGHTPTTYEARYMEDSVPGMISYRKNAVNIDGGCVFARNHPSYPCMLCALCLETLEEIYPCTIEERMREQMPEASEELQKAVSEALKMRHDAYLNNAYRMEIMGRLR